MRISITIEGHEAAQQLLEATASRLEEPPRPLLETLAAALQTYLQSHIQTQTGRTRSVQAFPFAYVTAGEVQDLVTLIQEYYFRA